MIFSSKCTIKRLTVWLHGVPHALAGFRGGPRNGEGRRGKERKGMAERWKERDRSLRLHDTM